MTFHCLFEQSGTFKNEFKKLGFDAIDYDILNAYGETDVQIDLFKEIDKAYDGQASIFDTFTKEDTLLAFFPCVRFESVIPLAFRGEQLQQKNWTLEQKLEYSMKLHTELHELYMEISKLCLICLRGGLRLMIENPYTQPHYLTQFWPVKPTVIDRDRTKRGDVFKKPTQYFFINFEPENNLIFDAMPVRKTRTIMGTHDTAMRSEISSEYANRFIREFLIKEDAPKIESQNASPKVNGAKAPTPF